MATVPNDSPVRSDLSAAEYHAPTASPIGTDDSAMSRGCRQRVLVRLVGWWLVVNSSVFAQDPISEQQIALRVHESFRGDVRISPLEIDVTVRGDSVVLEGNVPSFSHRIWAEALCKKIEGVEHVQNRLAVRSESTNEQSLSTDVKRRLKADSLLRHAQIEVDTQRQTVRLRGFVDSEFAKRRAEQVAAQVLGVGEIENELKVQSGDDHTFETVRRLLEQSVPNRPESTRTEDSPGKVDSRSTGPVVAVPPSPLSDDELVMLASQLQSVLNSVLATETGQVKVAASEGSLVLQGQVDSLGAKAQVVRFVRRVAAVIPVLDDIHVSAADRSDEIVQAEASALIASDALLAKQPIEVSVSEGTLTLTGTVEQYVDKQRAWTLAAQNPGVTAIENQLQVRLAAATGDAQLRSRIVSRLADHRGTSSFADGIVVTVHDGTATLVGKVPNWQARREAGLVASHTDGIREVVNKLSIGL